MLDTARVNLRPPMKYGGEFKKNKKYRYWHNRAKRVGRNMGFYLLQRKEKKGG
jgi:hypothetical protein